YEATLKRIARLAVPTIADWCVVDLIQNGALQRVSVSHADPDKEKLAYELEERYPQDPNASTGIPHVLRTGRPELIAEITDAEMAAAATDSQHLEILRRSEEHTYELQSLRHLVCRLLLEKNKII